MGYMGFGMRKEVYKRRPKEAFKKLKKHQKGRTGEVKDKGAPAEFELYKPFKPAYQRWWFKISAVLIIGFTIYTFLDNTVWAEQRLVKGTQLFEESGIDQFYKEQKSTIDSVFAFMEAREGRLNYVLKDWNSDLILGFRSADYNTKRAGRSEKDHHNSSQYSYGQTDYSVGDYELTFKKTGTSKTYSDYWSFDLHVEHMGKVPSGFLNHIDCTRADLDKFVRFIATKGWEVNYYENGHILHFRNLDSRYSIYLTDSLETFTEKDLKEFRTIEDGVYWTKSSYWY